MLLHRPLMPLLQLFQLFRVVLDVAQCAHRADAASAANAHTRSRCGWCDGLPAPRVARMETVRTDGAVPR
eukprot:679479-Prymnesium_polylepis.1